MQTIDQLERLHNPKSMLPTGADEKRQVLTALKSTVGTNGIVMRILDGMILFKATELTSKSNLKGVEAAVENYYKTGVMTGLIEFKKLIEQLFEKEEEDTEDVK